MGTKRTIPGSQGGSGPKVINAGVMTGTAVLTSGSIDVQNLDNIGLQFKWTGAAVGTIAIFGSVDNTNFYAWTPSPALTQPNNNAGGFITGLNQFPFPYLKVTYTNTSSTGVLTVWLSAKDLN